MNTLSALLPAAISAIVGFSVSHLVAQKITTASKLQKFLSFVIFVSIGIGITGVLNELLVPIFVGGTSNFEKITMFTFANIFLLPIVLYIFIHLSKKLAPKLNNDTFTPSDLSGSTNNNEEHLGFTKKQWGIFLVICLFSLFSYAVLGDLFTKEKKFDVIECESCNTKGVTGTTECKTNNHYKQVIVNESKVVLHGTNADGQIFIREYPSSDTKCVINHKNKFSFLCSSSTMTTASNNNFNLEFDGKDVFKSSWRYEVFMNNEYRLLQEIKSSCKVN